MVKFMADKGPDIGERCYVFEKFGKCPYGAACRYGSGHVTSGFVNVVREGAYVPSRPPETSNLVSRDLQESLRKRRLAFVRSERYLERLAAARDLVEGDGKVGQEDGETEGAVTDETNTTKDGSGKVSPPSGAVTDIEVVKLRPLEKRKVSIDKVSALPYLLLLVLLLLLLFALD